MGGLPEAAPISSVKNYLKKEFYFFIIQQIISNGAREIISSLHKYTFCVMNLSLRFLLILSGIPHNSL